MAEMAPKKLEANSTDGDLGAAPPDELGGCTGCCVMCCFGCLTCCGCRDVICRKLIFFPPSPPFYKIGKDETKKDIVLHRIPLALLPQTEDLSEEDLKNMSPATLQPSLNVQMVKLKTTRNSEIMACHITHPKATDTVLYSHGNATDVGMQSYAVETLVIACRVNVLFYDYTGYGYSANHGKPSPKHIGADIQAAYDYLVKEVAVPSNRIIIYGQSLGSVPSCILASKHRVKGMVIHAGLASAIRVLKPSINKSPWFDLFRNSDVIKEAKCPVYIIHGTEDMAVPFSNGKLLYDNAPHKIRPWWVEGAHHNDIEICFARQYYVRLTAAFREFSDIEKKRNTNDDDAKTTDETKETAVIISQPPKTSL
mmetsp:Transcript_11953/g.16559  ORF Transcript_11953/g.16559 Transcript_11953/m.16559 type:complete len:367 (+) Transcript_11953:138-1238(+)|eukprot:CAMPEP_0185267088 /NCGR_PEP_ID=MMETSP1359-20130426/33360_1 /TAXON_ID=552665 /ORGANISM="Bigelowiella longifila, Strain CCMP242" /LENGTH=366 /DNA_ID=CAMNT_0027857287 /DNA_START=131 /DNA_END=1231 /DNA_ORIENTATION=-